MNDSEKLNIDTIFCSAIEIESPIERQAYLQRACGDDSAAIRQVERLLAAHFRGGSILDAPGHALCRGVDSPPAERVGAVIGPYQLLELIGEGGMGLVYMAEQQRPVRRRVALKIIRPGLDSQQVIARFEAERQALAMMDHPHIAKVLDAGTVEDGTRDWELGARDGVTRQRLSAPNHQPAVPSSGRPYFVMELVRGIPITQFCDERQLDTRQRLELFVQICRAIQHAHQKGIIHRDIKPTNVLVELQDDSPVAKVIDFGVAKAIGQQLTSRTLYTGFSQMIGTPLYMSPEQTELNAVDVDSCWSSKLVDGLIDSALGDRAFFTVDSRGFCGSRLPSLRGRPRMADALAARFTCPCTRNRGLLRWETACSTSGDGCLRRLALGHSIAAASGRPRKSLRVSQRKPQRAKLRSPPTETQRSGFPILFRSGKEV